MSRILGVLGLVASGALIYLIATQFDLAQALRAIRSADPLWLGLATASYCLLFVLRGRRWVVLLQPIKKVSTGAATEAFLIGFMANNVLPARLGDVTRALVLAKREKVPRSATFSNVMLERIFDGLTVVAILSLVLWIAPPDADWVAPVGWGMAALFGGLVLCSGLVAWRQAWMVARLHDVLGHGPRVRQLADLVAKVGRGLATLRDPGQTAHVLGLSWMIWALEVVVYLFLQEAFGLTVPVLGMALVMSVLTLGLTVPSAPGFVGVFEAAVIAGVTIFGVAPADATAFAITLHLIHYIPGTLLGLFFAWKSGLRLREIRTQWTWQSSEPGTLVSSQEPVSPKWDTGLSASTPTAARSQPSSREGSQSTNLASES